MTDEFELFEEEEEEKVPEEVEEIEPPERDLTEYNTQQMAQLIIISVHRALAGGTRHYDERDPSRVLRKPKEIVQALRSGFLIIQPPAGSENFYRGSSTQPKVDLDLALPPVNCEYGLAYVSCQLDKTPGQIFCEGHLETKCKHCGGEAIRQCHEGTSFICGTDLCGGCECPVVHYTSQPAPEIVRGGELLSIEEEMERLKAERLRELGRGKA